MALLRCTPLTIEEQASTGGFTHRIDFSYLDIPAGIAVNTAKLWTTGELPAVAIGDIIVKTELHITTKFAVSPNDAAFTSTTLSFGDVTTATRFINASETNTNGTAVLDVIPGATQNAIYTLAGQLTLTLTPLPAAKTLSSLNVGQGYILLSVNRAAAKSRVKAPPFGDGRS